MTIDTFLIATSAVALSHIPCLYVYKGHKQTPLINFNQTVGELYLKITLKRTIILVSIICLGAVFRTALFSSKPVSIPILLYHDIDATGQGGSTIAADVFLDHLDAIKAAGYQTISFQEMIDFVSIGAALPKKPIVITFDDGYLSNYEIAWPAFLERDMVGTIFVIGCSVGKTTYKDTDVPIIPHFSYEQAQEMIRSGAMSIQSHTYDMHQYRPLEADGGREGVLPRTKETLENYRMALHQDFSAAFSQINDNTGNPVSVLAYPFGLYTEDSEQISAQLGVQASLTTKMEAAQLVYGDPSCLRLMGRYSIDDCTPDELFAIIAP